ncbi:MAG: complex I subunit 5 family protein [bacterium]|nr:complex I subunit 5 family protein [bacterium]
MIIGFLSFSVPEICGMGLRFTVDGFRLIYACVAAFMWLMAAIFSGEYFKGEKNTRRFYLFLFLTLGAVLGVFLSADLYTTFLFFEIMSFTSYVWVAQEENGPSLRAACTYLAVAVIGGLVMLMGIFLLYHHLGTLVIDELFAAGAACENKGVLYAAGGCLLFGFGAKAGAFPLHIWLPKAHPVAPAPASALLSGALTKTGIYGILILSCHLFWHDAMWGKAVLLLGLVTMAWGAVLAVLSVDLKRTLACSSMSQIGFILTGIGMQGMLGEENAPAVHGTLLHMVNHSLIKLILFLAAGVVYRSAHALELNRIRGWGRKKPLAAGCFLIGALAIAGVPLFGGYISKTLLHEAILKYGGGGLMKAAEWIFLFCGGLTAAYMAKLFIAVFVEKNQDASLQEFYDGQKSYMGWRAGFALTGSALVLLIWGLFPHGIMERAARLGESFMRLREHGEAVAYFSPECLAGGLISLGIGAAVYLLFVRGVLKKENRYVDRWPEKLDLEDLIYRPLLLKILPAVFGVLCRIPDCLTDTLTVALRKTVYRDSPLPHERPEGNVFTEALGKLMNGWERIGNLTWHREAPRRTDYSHVFAVKYEEIKETNRIIGRSLSFGLLLFGVGLALTLVYLIWF